MNHSTYAYNLGLAFYETARTSAENTAFRYPDGNVVTYTQLNKLSNAFARLLLKKGVSQGAVVAIFNDKSPNAYALMLGCLKIGAIYTNLDATSPWQRLEKIIKTCLPSVVCFDRVNEEIEQQVVSLDLRIATLRIGADQTQTELAQMDIDDLPETLLVHGSNPAYIMFTSGSTGFPKGAVMSHNNVLNFVQWGKQTFNVTSEDVFTNANPIYFDNSVFDFYVSIFNGAKLVPLDSEIVKQPQKLVNAINEAGCTIWFSVPSLLVYLLTTKSLTQADFATVKRISFGGEGFPKSKLKQLFELFGDRVTLFNVYGPTECTCICSSYKISASDFDNMNELAPLGYIAPNFGYEILQIGDNPVIGELCLIGPCVGLGYYNDPERTANSFVNNTKARFNQIMYKTGDLVENAKNGYLHFKGRTDNQVKHMGYRIELEEIEAAFSSLSYIDEVGVIYEKINTELGQIKAFVCVNDKEMDAKGIQEAVKKILPPYMIPRIIQVMEVLPKNQNGKIDRKQLKEL